MKWMSRSPPPDVDAERRTSVSLSTVVLMTTSILGEETSHDLTCLLVTRIQRCRRQRSGSPRYPAACRPSALRKVALDDRRVCAVERAQVRREQISAAFPAQCASGLGGAEYESKCLLGSRPGSRAPSDART